MCSLWCPPKAPPWLQSLAEPPPTAPSPPPFASGVSSPMYQTSVTTVLSNHCCNCLETSFSCLPLLLLLLRLLRAMFRAPLSPGDSLLCLLKARTSGFCVILRNEKVGTPDQPPGVILRGLLLAPVVHPGALVVPAGKSFRQSAVREHAHVTAPVKNTHM